MHVDFAELRKKVPIASVLRMYQIEVRKRSDTEIIANCPFASHPTDSTHQWTLAISTELGKAFCHNTRCREASNKPKGLDAIDFVAMMENVPLLDAAKKLQEMFALSTSKPSSIPASAPVTNTPLAFALKKLDPTHPFIKERGITLETAKEFGVGFHSGKGSMSNRICFPLHENGALIGYAGRSVNGEEPKWKMPQGIVRTFLYGLERCDPSKPLTITESCWGVLHLFQHHIQAVALIGVSLTETQEKLLEPFAEIRIALDNDSAGHEAAAKLTERLRKNHKVTKAFLSE
jgi:DNA primase